MSRSVVSDFVTGFQFLTRIQIIHQTSWSPDALGRSIKFFPLVGCSIGLILAGVYLVQNLLGLNIPVHTMAAAIIMCEIMITGGLHCDGFMDTVDGIFSGRSPERMLEIMKDSRVGAFGVIGFCLLILEKYSLLLDLQTSGVLPVALIAMPVVGRMASVAAITLFPYARPDGLGKLFYQYTDKRDLYIASVMTLLMLAALGNTALFAGAGGVITASGMANYINKRLGGLTGDIYGAIIEVTEVIVLVIFVGIELF